MFQLAFGLRSFDTFLHTQCNKYFQSTAVATKWQKYEYEMEISLKVRKVMQTPVYRAPQNGRTYSSRCSDVKYGNMPILQPASSLFYTESRMQQQPRPRRICNLAKFMQNLSISHFYCLPCMHFAPFHSFCLTYCKLLVTITTALDTVT